MFGMMTLQLQDSWYFNFNPTFKDMKWAHELIWHAKLKQILCTQIKGNAHSRIKNCPQFWR